MNEINDYCCDDEISAVQSIGDIIVKAHGACKAEKGLIAQGASRRFFCSRHSFFIFLNIRVFI